MKIYSKLSQLQQKLQIPKTRYNKFGDFYYRNADDILASLKPELGEYVILLTDKIIEMNGDVYVEGVATLTNGEETISVSGYAREERERPKMSPSQLTGSASTYARKYALNGLLGLDDAEDPDSKNNTVEIAPQKTEVAQINKQVNKEDAELVIEVLKIDPNNEFYKNIGEGLKRYGKLTEKQRERLKEAIQRELDLGHN